MSIRLFNTLTRSTDTLTPLHDKEIRMYTCGPTVYNNVHIGNWRAYIFADLLKRYLKYRGYGVTHVMNVTDVDDKTIKGAHESGTTLKEYTDHYTNLFLHGLEELRIERPDTLPRVSDHIEDIITFIQKLLDRGYAYKSDGSVYFRIKKSPKYGALALLDAQELKPNASERNNRDEYEKENISDFALWKAWQESDGDMYWESSFGKGRPGWHIECSVLSTKYLGEQFDIHTGGVDLIFPHHTNEIAQTEAITEKKFVSIWLHNAHLVIDGKKMSKSLRNFFTLEDVRSMGIHPIIMRFLLIRTHFQHEIDFSRTLADEARQIFIKYATLFCELESDRSGDGWSGIDTALFTAEKEFTEALDDNLNISNALRALFELGTTINANLAKLTIEEKRKVMDRYRKFDTVTSVFIPAYEIYKKARMEKENDPKIRKLAEERQKARAAKDYATADNVRNELLAQGVAIRDIGDTGYALDVIDWI
ncbi:MAG: cysteine--tRNA ligase [Candidatus Yonathbacteria bacterium CG_4_10_14_3_um_filter_47_65]|uniref:Cysteine--tRNA ligase n=2 Tax=Parcubacteria group TaxID=1794811 RepID=A0A2M8D5E5_9BACT|nr:MAG: cysteine--tRNA ligase [Candidatus Nomurabacteria bacterium CG1_02_47_685]PIP03802.1 MAG: cysteine--tRNA ligase [Candidatus Yonathbacteria bacterium CG23_combo_of_CG06-09_8_20_14_all_46_18]PIQ32520.1 MAG: cysteine--tRNA ligase [Candidatus Yonathbacteria bacterium CG17_big_fil_post_rev_8_21_14_2_50_46_19]PIX56416.1 MAG: cysteine--tRNA ligase [Candidatus Yonathbacteria bacterium CG_4_10_14_3_um_filter_47_65]PIY57961.1 MAG: cysteine--tRNA ligase [Candidatus Yonathbacteria bacterium CG_4_10_